MSDDRDLVPVASNGHRPVERRAAGQPSDEELSIAFSPRQMAVGFGILASVVVLLAGWLRRRSGH